MACLACVGACSEAFYKVFDPDKACLQIVEKRLFARSPVRSAVNVPRPVRKAPSPRTRRAFT